MSRRIRFIVIGAVILALATFAAVAGVVLAAAFASGNTLATGPHPVASATRALVFPVAEIDGLGAAPSALGQARVLTPAPPATGVRDAPPAATATLEGSRR